MSSPITKYEGWSRERLIAELEKVVPQPDTHHDSALAAQDALSCNTLLDVEVAAYIDALINRSKPRWQGLFKQDVAPAMLLPQLFWILEEVRLSMSAPPDGISEIELREALCNRVTQEVELHREAYFGTGIPWNLPSACVLTVNGSAPGGLPRFNQVASHCIKNKPNLYSIENLELALASELVSAIPVASPLIRQAQSDLGAAMLALGGPYQNAANAKWQIAQFLEKFLKSALLSIKGSEPRLASSAGVDRALRQFGHFGEARRAPGDSALGGGLLYDQYLRSMPPFEAPGYDEHQRTVLAKLHGELADPASYRYVAPSAMAVMEAYTLYRRALLFLAVEQGRLQAVFCESHYPCPKVRELEQTFGWEPPHVLRGYETAVPLGSDGSFDFSSPATCLTDAAKALQAKTLRQE